MMSKPQLKAFVHLKKSKITSYHQFRAAVFPVYIQPVVQKIFNWVNNLILEKCFSTNRIFSWYKKGTVSHKMMPSAPCLVSWVSTERARLTRFWHVKLTRRDIIFKFCSVHGECLCYRLEVHMVLPHQEHFPLAL